MGLGFGGAGTKVVRGFPGKTNVDAAMRICIAKLHGAAIHKHWTNTSSISCNKQTQYFWLKFNKIKRKLAKEKHSLEMCRNKKIFNIAVAYH